MAIIRNTNSYSEAKNEEENTTPRRISKKLDLLDSKMDSLYKDIYITRPDNKKNLDQIFSQLDTSIDQIQNSNDMSVSGMTELLRRIDNKEGTNTRELMNSVNELFNDQNLLAGLFMNDNIHKFIAGQNYQYDMICKYLPKLQDALDLKKDNVLCSDNFSKNFLNPNSGKSSKRELEKFNSNKDRIEKEYEMQEFLEKSYDNISKYGEEFIYIVPYATAIKKMLGRNLQRQNTNFGPSQMNFYESVNYTQEKEFIKEGFVTSDDFKSYKESIHSPIEEADDVKFSGFGINLYFNHTNVVQEKLNDILVLESQQDVEKFSSMAKIYGESFASIVSEASGDLSKDMEEAIKKNNKLYSATANDGLILPDYMNKDPEKVDKKLNGAVLERLPRENVVPIYIGKKCLGYYYLEFAEDKSACGFCGSHHMTPGISNASNYAYEMSEDQQEMVIRYIASRMSQHIDTNFINANKDLKEEIYAVLRFNEKFDISRTNNIGVTFIPAEDIVHGYFLLDEETHRGISDLYKAVVPAMLYILLYLTDIIGKISRSTDKRIYYVKQNVETNVARTMMNVVQQIKKGNMGMRQIESMNNILNIVGKYNDFIIPMGQSGDPPIQFEVMQGQDIQTPTEIMEKMEESAVSTVCPYEMVNSSYQQDFAVRFTMSNTRFLKNVYTRQRKTQNVFSKIYTKVYNYEFGENLSEIKIILPPPIYLTLQNNQQLFDNVSGQADKIVEHELSDEDEAIQKEFKRLYMRDKLESYLDYARIDKMIEAARVNIESKKPPQVEGGDDSDLTAGDDEF